MTSVFVSSGDSEWDSRTGEIAEILHRLGSDEADVVDVGPMFHIRFNDGVELDAFIDELPDLGEYLFGEVVFDITTCVPLFTAKGAPAENFEYDSRDLYASIFEWAKEFEQKYPEPGFDYLNLVEEFARKKLHGFFELEG